jgi:hypothetical protein
MNLMARSPPDEIIDQTRKAVLSKRGQKATELDDI